MPFIRYIGDVANATETPEPTRNWSKSSSELVFKTSKSKQDPNNFISRKEVSSGQTNRVVSILLDDVDDILYVGNPTFFISTNIKEAYYRLRLVITYLNDFNEKIITKEDYSDLVYNENISSCIFNIGFPPNGSSKILLELGVECQTNFIINPSILIDKIEFSGNENGTQNFTTIKNSNGFPNFQSWTWYVNDSVSDINDKIVKIFNVPESTDTLLLSFRTDQNLSSEKLLRFNLKAQTGVIYTIKTFTRYVNSDDLVIDTKINYSDTVSAVGTNIAGLNIIGTDTEAVKAFIEIGIVLSKSSKINMERH